MITDHIQIPALEKMSDSTGYARSGILPAYRAVAAIQIVVLFWESQDYDDVLAQLQKALDLLVNRSGVKRGWIILHNMLSEGLCRYNPQQA